MTYPDPKSILTSDCPAQDLRQLVGYVWVEGNFQKEFPSEHFLKLVDYFIAKFDL